MKRTLILALLMLASCSKSSGSATHLQGTVYTAGACSDTSYLVTQRPIVIQDSTGKTVGMATSGDGQDGTQWDSQLQANIPTCTAHFSAPVPASGFYRVHIEGVSGEPITVKAGARAVIFVSLS